MVNLAPSTPETSGGLHGRRVIRLVRKYGTLAAPIIVLILFSLASDRFLTAGNFRSIVKEWTILGTLALGFTFVVAAGEFDLSFGYLVALSSIAVAMMLNAGVNAFLVIPAVLAIGVVVGLSNGLLVVKVGLPAFIATIGVGALCQGTNYLFSRAAPIPISCGMFPDWLAFVGQGYLLELPATVTVFVPLALLAVYILTQTRLGRHVYAVGMNPTAARKAGVNLAKVKLFSFMCCSTGAVIVGLLITCRSGSGQSIAGPEYLLDVFASVFFGMSLFKEGEVNPEGTMLGAFFMVVLANGLTLMNMPFYILKIVQGVVILMSVSVASWRKSRQ